MINRELTVRGTGEAQETTAQNIHRGELGENGK